MTNKQLAASAIFIAACLVGCATVRQQDLDAWVGAPVEALDTHSFFITLPMVRTVTESGIEIRNYPNKRNIGGCFSFGNTYGYINSATYNSFATCSSNLVGCDNIFYIKNGRVVEYAPTGRCKTDETVQPQRRYLRLKAQ